MLKAKLATSDKPEWSQYQIHGSSGYNKLSHEGVYRLHVPESVINYNRCNTYERCKEKASFVSKIIKELVC